MKTLKNLLSSKKFLVMLASVITYVASIWGFDVDPERVLPVLGIAAVYLGAQGAADFGKEAKKVEGGA